jgi:tricorn protease
VSRSQSGLHEIYTMKPNGTERKALTNNQAYDTSPAYSPNGERIVFVGQGENEDILVMNANDGSARKNLTNTPPVNGYEVRERPRLLAGWYQDSLLQGIIPTARCGPLHDEHQADGDKAGNHTDNRLLGEGVRS